MDQKALIEAAATYYYYDDDITETNHAELDYQVVLELREENDVTN